MLRKFGLGLVAVGMAIVLTAVFIVSRNTSTRQSVQYDIRYVADEVPWLEVTVTFSGDGTGALSVRLPAADEFGESFDTGVTDLEMLSPYSMIDYGERGQYRLSHAVDGHGVLRYRISGVETHTIDFSTVSETYQIVSQDFIHLTLNGSLPVPYWPINRYNADAEVDVRISWHDLPNGWTVADNFGRGQGTRRFRSTARQLAESRLVAGDFQTTSRNVDGVQIQIAVLGVWPFSLNEYAVEVVAFAKVHREFWGDESREGYLSTLIAIDDFQSGSDQPRDIAHADRNGSTIFTTRDTPLELLRHTISHEYLHRWFGGAFGFPEPPYQVTRWFNEGFTNFYAAYIPYRAGEVDQFEYLLWLSMSLFNQAGSEHRNATQQDVVEGFGNSNSLALVPYWRGHMLAANWHTMISQATGGELSLHDLLFEFREAQDTLRENGERWVWNSETIVEVLERHGFNFARADYQRVLVEGGDLPLSQGMIGPCFIPDPAVINGPDDPPSSIDFPESFFEVLEEGQMTVDERAACRAWLDLE